MALIIRDETANSLVLTIDDSGNMAFADGTPIDLLTIDAWGIIDHDGTIVHGLGSNTVNPSVGAADCGIGEQVTIQTISGRVPIVQVYSQYPAGRYFIDFRDPTDPSQGGSESVQTLNTTVHNLVVQSGSFTVSNNNEGDGFVNDPNSQYYDPSLASAPFTFKWI